MANFKDDSFKEEASAFGQRVKGAVKEGAGKISGNERLEREGERENAMGRQRQAVNDVFDKADGNYGDRTTYGGRLVTGMYNSRDDAERAYNDLRSRHGYQDRDISVLMSEDTRKRHFGDVKPGTEFQTESKALEGAGVGGMVGGALGALIAGIAAAGTNLILPGLGLVVAGPLAAALAGAGAGGATGGLIGALIGAGIPEDRAREYEQGISQGGIVLGTRARDDIHADELESHFRGYGGSQVRR